MQDRNAARAARLAYSGLPRSIAELTTTVCAPSTFAASWPIVTATPSRRSSSTSGVNRHVGARTPLRRARAECARSRSCRCRRCRRSDSALRLTAASFLRVRRSTRARMVATEHRSPRSASAARCRVSSRGSAATSRSGRPRAPSSSPSATTTARVRGAQTAARWRLGDFRRQADRAPGSPDLSNRREFAQRGSARAGEDEIGRRVPSRQIVEIRHRTVPSARPKAARTRAYSRSPVTCRSCQPAGKPPPSIEATTASLIVRAPWLPPIASNVLAIRVEAQAGRPLPHATAGREGRANGNAGLHVLSGKSRIGVRRTRPTLRRRAARAAGSSNRGGRWVRAARSARA